MGIAAAILWTGQTNYLIRSSVKEEKGRSAGFFDTLLFSGSAIGVIALGFLSAWQSPRTAFMLAAFSPIIGFLLLLLFLPGIEVIKADNQLALVKKTIKSPSSVKIAGLWFIVSFCIGLSTGIIPIQIEKNFSIIYIGLLTSLFSICPILFSYISGIISDSIGRKKLIWATYIFIILGLALLLFSGISKTFLVLGIITLALAWTMGRVSFFSFTGDISSQNNLAPLAALFWMAQGVGLIAALLLGRLLNEQIELLYIIAIITALISLVIIYPLLRLKIAELQSKIAAETDNV